MKRRTVVPEDKSNEFTGLDAGLIVPTFVTRGRHPTLAILVQKLETFLRADKKNEILASNWTRLFRHIRIYI